LQFDQSDSFHFLLTYIRTFSPFFDPRLQELVSDGATTTISETD
jgi:hypothetical protein